MKTLLMILSLCVGIQAGPGLLPDGKLDMNFLQTAYKEGKLEEVKEVLEVYLKEKGDGAGKGELVFICKYLGAIYAENPNERPRADSYFSQLLDLVPDVELSETFTSGNVHKIFAESKKDFQRAKEYNATHDAFGKPIQVAKDAPGLATASPQNSELKSQTKSHAWVWWTAGLTTVAAGAGVAAWMMLPEPTPESKHFVGAF